MSDTSQGPGWWQASDGKWYPPEQHASAQSSAAAPPPPSQGEQKKMSGCLKWGLVALGVMAVLGVLVVACVGAVGNEVANEIERQVGTADEGDYDLELSNCENDSEFGSSTASGTITNNSGEAQGFQIDVRFEAPDGTLIEISPTFVDRLNDGQTGNWETSTFAAGAGEEGVTCETDEVSYSIFDE